VSPFRIEGPVCFAKCPPGFELRIDLYDLYPDGSKNLLITIAPEFTQQDED
jgi:hypothetical protein